MALPGDMPLRVLPLPDGRRALILTGGYHDHSLSVVDIAGGKTLHNLELGKDWAGLATDSAGSTVYVSGGGPILKKFEKAIWRKLPSMPRFANLFPSPSSAFLCRKIN